MAASATSPLSEAMDGGDDGAAAATCLALWLSSTSFSRCSPAIPVSCVGRSTWDPAIPLHEASSSSKIDWLLLVPPGLSLWLSPSRTAWAWGMRKSLDRGAHSALLGLGRLAVSESESSLTAGSLAAKDDSIEITIFGGDWALFCGDFDGDPSSVPADAMAPSAGAQLLDTNRGIGTHDISPCATPEAMYF